MLTAGQLDRGVLERWLGDVKPTVKELWYLGNWQGEMPPRMAAVIGSRQMTQYGRRAVEILVPQLVADGWTIVSGFMYGVDRTAHEICLTVGGKTIAVLGWGIDEQIDDLGRAILAAEGLIFSEWKKQKGALWTFPLRNRIVAALCQRVYVVEAGVKSGSLGTVEIAKKMGKEIWAVPGPITSAVSLGTNSLIATGQAKLWMPQMIKNRYIKSTDLYSLLQNEPLTIDELCRLVEKPIDVLSYELMQLQLLGQIEERDGKYWVI